MRKALLALVSIAAIVVAGCATSDNNPWASPDSQPVSHREEAAPVATAAPSATSTPSDALFTEEAADDEAPAPAPAARPASAPAPAVAPAPQSDGDLLADYPAIRQANLDKALRALKKAAEIEELSMPEKGNARITRFNAEVGVIEFITPTEYAEGTDIVLTKEGKAALVSVIAIDNGRYIADLAPNVQGAPALKPGDFVLCDIYRSPEELAKIAAEQRKAQQEAIRAARAAAQQERSLLAEDDEEEGDDEEAAEEDSGDDEEDEDEDEEYDEDEDEEDDE